MLRFKRPGNVIWEQQQFPCVMEKAVGQSDSELVTDISFDDMAQLKLDFKLRTSASM